MNASVIVPPITPAQIRVASCPIVSAVGPVIANERGTPSVEIIQSRANTRPRRRSGTSRWTSVTQTTTR